MPLIHSDKSNIHTLTFIPMLEKARPIRASQKWTECQALGEVPTQKRKKEPTSISFQILQRKFGC